MATTERSHYEVLGVSPEATGAEIKAAYRKLVKTLHPDLPTGSQALFGVITEAYEVLSAPAKREAYDRSRSGGSQAGAPGAGSGSGSAAGNPGDRGHGANHGANQGAPNGTGQQGSGSDFRFTADPNQAGPFTRAYAAAANGQRAADPWAGLRQRAGQRAGQRTVPAVPSRGRGGSVAWWSFPLILAVTFGAGLIRFTGLTETLFDVHPGDPLMFGRTWENTPTLFDGGFGPTAKSAAVVAVMCLALAVGFWWRKQQAPMSRVEKIVLLVAWAVLAGAAEFLLVSGTAWLVLAGAVAAYGGWVWLLKQLPAPGTTEQWESFGQWVKGVRAYEARAAEVRQQRRTTQREQRREQRRQQLNRILHWK